jgi:hypothetical protein
VTARRRGAMLLVWLAAPLAALPAIGWLLMEYGPERSILFALYPLVWGIVFLVVGLVVARRRPDATSVAVLLRAAAWASILVVATVMLLVVASMFLHP